jgi:hypothetical protein
MSIARRRRVLPAARHRIASALISVLLAPILPRLDAEPASAQVLVNEFITANASGLVDEDGDREDWIELHNSGTVVVDLSGYGLTDDIEEPFKWIVPRILLAPDSLALVIASGKDRRIWARHWETVIDWGDTWRWKAGDSEPPASWRLLAFDDSGWESGPSGLGFGDGDDATVVPQGASFYIRRRFQVESLDGLTAAVLHVDYDDAFVAYLNGVEVARANIGSPGVPPSHSTLADFEHEARIYLDQDPETFPLPSSATDLLLAGDNVLAIQVHNQYWSSNDLSMIPFLSLGFAARPAGATGVPPVLETIMPMTHASFALDENGELLSLFAPSGLLLDQVHTGMLVPDVSRGRQPDGAASWLFFDPPTPLAPNSGPGCQGVSAGPAASPLAAMYGGPITVTLSSQDPGAIIRYTTDGAEPTAASTPYVFPVAVDTTTVIRARAWTPGMVPSLIATSTFLIDESTDLPVVSLATDPPNLWDEEIGIYVLGPNASPIPPYFGANFWQDWERPIHIECFDPIIGSRFFEQDAGVKIHGGYTRMKPQKSLRLIARSGYGEQWFDHAFFGAAAPDRFKRLILRNAGNDWCDAHLRDELMQAIARHTDLDCQAYQPTIVFLNGVYWGIHHLRERQDEFYLESRYGIDSDDVDIIENARDVVEGDAQHWDTLMDFVEGHDLSIQSHFECVQTMMEVDDFAEYCIFEIFLNNSDWPQSNRKCWRPRTADGRWRWFLFDLDFGLGWEQPVDFDMMAWATDPEGPGGNFAWSTVLLRKLLDNEGFRHAFINRYADHLNTTFRPTAMLEVLDEIRDGIATEVPRHYARWTQPVSTWYDNLTVISRFMEERPALATGHIMNHFGLTATLTLSLDIEPPGAGSIRLTAATIDGPWSGTYFQDVPITLTAVPDAEHVFAGWSDPELPGEATVVISPAGDDTLVACFAPAAPPVINEINYNSSPTVDPEDWVELVNPAPSPRDLSGWIFRDAENSHTFTIPPGTVIDGEGYLVLCRDTAQFHACFPEVAAYMGDLGFGFDGGGELLRLFDASDQLVDWVEYDDVPPWPPGPDGNGPTLELRAHGLDNTLPSSWAASTVLYGTPGSLNSVAGGTAVAGAVPEPILSLGLPVPNPFNPHTTLGIALPASAPVRLAVYDSQGRLVRVLIDARLDAGRHAIRWDGRTDLGRAVASGVYYGELRTGDVTLRRKMLLLR